MNFFQQSQRVMHRHSTYGDCKPAVIEKVTINESRKGVVWLANSYYVVRGDDGSSYVIDLVDAHHTNGGMTVAA